MKPCGEVFYIGIGTIKRPYSKHNRNKHWHNIVNKYGYEIQILKSNLKIEEATELEIILIDYYGKISNKTGTLCNVLDGGTGLDSYKWSKEAK